jgi:hypothetical protein
LDEGEEEEEERRRKWKGKVKRMWEGGKDGKEE